jgi:hypothetical protein
MEAFHGQPPLFSCEQVEKAVFVALVLFVVMGL